MTALTMAATEQRSGELPAPSRLRLCPLDELSAGQPVLGVPVDRGRLVARTVGAAHQRYRLAGPPPGRLTVPVALYGHEQGTLERSVSGSKES